jgi:Holliday junction resolvase RusA-like endonuclease
MEFFVAGRPAPQGSKQTGTAGQLREQSPHLPAWRAAIKKRVYEIYKAEDVLPAHLPRFRGAIEIECVFWLDTGQRIDSPPDVDKLLRAVLDALTIARVYEDDGRVVRAVAEKRQVRQGFRAGARIKVFRTEVS